MLPKADTTLRIALQNMNGIPAKPGNSKLQTCISTAQHYEVDLLLMTETNIDTSQHKGTQLLQQRIESVQQFPRPSSIFSSSSISSHRLYKPGGTGIVSLSHINRQLQPHIDKAPSDTLGRWSEITLRGANHKLVTIICAYQVCPKPTNRVGNMAFHQQEILLAKSSRGHQTPQQAFIQDLTAHISLLQSAGHLIIVGGDFNESILDANSGILKLMTTTGITDPWTMHYPREPEFGTHQCGQCRIDFFLVSPELAPLITSISYMPFQSITDSDHRPIIVDFDRRRLLGSPLCHLPPPMSRNVTSKDKTSAASFVRHVYAHLENNHIFEKLPALTNTLKIPTIETFDRILGDAFQLGIRRTKQRRPEWFSNELFQSRQQLQALRRHLTCLEKGIDVTEALTQRLSTIDINITFSMTESATRAQIKTIKHQLDQKRAASFHLRQAHLTRPSTHLSTHKSSLSAAQAIAKSEQEHSMYKVMRHLRGKSISSTNSINQLLVPADWPDFDPNILDQPITLSDPKTTPTNPQNWKLITDPKQISFYLLLRNRRHFGQAQGTPFTVPPAIQYFDWLASTDFAEDVLHGDADLSTFPTLTAALLQFCKQKVPSDTTPFLTDTDLVGKFSVWKEQTSTSPSGRHLGCYKSLCVTLPDPKLNAGEPDPSRPSLSTMQERIRRVILSILNSCLHRCHVLTRWKTVVNTMIFKSPGDYHVHKLRVIHLYEADLNLFFAVKWRRTMHRAERLNAINSGQIGGRQGREAQHLALAEELKNDYSILSRRPVATFDNDASSCYDRIVPAFASLANRVHGHHPKVVSLHASILYSIKYKLKVMDQISSDSYSHCPRFPIYGTGQGSGNSPSIWTFVSSILFDAHNDLSHGATFVSTTGSESLQASMLGFVDDSTGITAPFRAQSSDTAATLLRQATYDAQLWNSLLFTSGGQLELNKCSFHLMAYTFAANGQPTLDKTDYNFHIHIEDPTTGRLIPIKYMKPSQAHKLLGHWKAPADKQSKQLSDLTTRAISLSRMIGTAPITRHSASKAYAAIFIHSIGYVLPQSKFTLKQLYRLEASCMEPIFSKVGYHCKTRRSILYPSRNAGGGGFIRLATLQCEGQIQNFIKHWRTSSDLSVLLRIVLSWAQLVSGHGKPILSDPHVEILLLSQTWIDSLRQSLSFFDTAIHVDEPFLPEMPRASDVSIMDVA